MARLFVVRSTRVLDHFSFGMPHPLEIEMLLCVSDTTPNGTVVLRAQDVNALRQVTFQNATLVRIKLRASCLAVAERRPHRCCRKRDFFQCRKSQCARDMKTLP